MNDRESSIGSRLRERRRAVGLTTEDVAAHLGIATSAVRNHENGTNGVPLKHIERYAELYRASPSWLSWGVGLSPDSAGGPPVSMTRLANGDAKLELNMVLPFAVAVQILALVEGAK